MTVMRSPGKGLGAGILLATVLLIAGNAGPGPQQKKSGVASPVTPAATPTPAFPQTWKEIDALVSQQKFQEALRGVEAILASAKKTKDSAEWTKALIRATQLRMGLHGAEGAVRFLKDEPWPSDLPSRTALELFYAQTLVNYARTYSWELERG